jgi:Uma2 family endonuclease
MLCDDLLLSRRRAEHNMGMPATHARRWTADEVRRLIEESPAHWPRYELVDGELLVSPAPSFAHQRALEWFRDALKPYLKREGIGELLGSPADLSLTPGTISQPDLFVVPLSQAERARVWSDVSGLRLTIEVLSPGTARHDRGRKRIHYQGAGVEEYWIVDLEARLVERWRPADERPETLTLTLAWHPVGATSPLTVELGELWAAARLDIQG